MLPDLSLKYMTVRNVTFFFLRSWFSHLSNGDNNGIEML